MNIDKRPRRTQPLAQLIRNLAPQVRARREAEATRLSQDYYEFSVDLGLTRGEAARILEGHMQTRRPFAYPSRSEYWAAKQEIIQHVTGAQVEIGPTQMLRRRSS